MSRPVLVRKARDPRHRHGLAGRFRLLALAPAAAGLAVAIAVPAAAAATATAAAHVGAPQRAARPAALPRSGIWTAVSAGMNAESPAPALWVAPNGVGWDVFPRQVGPNNFTYEAVQAGTSGKVIHGPADTFAAAHWGSLQSDPTLLGVGLEPLLIFAGLRGSSGVYSLGCVYGALGSPTTWAVAPWTLSQSCVNPVPAAAESGPSAKVVAAAWPAGWVGGSGVSYRIGVSAAIPAKTADAHIALTKATAYQTGMAFDAGGNGHFYVAWTQVFSTPASSDGIYVKDVTAGTVTRRAPGTGTASSNTDFPGFARLATVARNVKGGGVYLAYCANKAPCQLELWRVGAAKAMAVPASANALSATLAQGPGGRIWVAWSNKQSNKVYVARTNKAATRFGPVRGYATPCATSGLLGLGGSPLAKLDIGLSCLNNALKQEQFLTQVVAGLTVAFPGTVHLGTTGVTVTITVTDAGDPVAGATVTFAGKTLKTSTAGRVSVKLAASAKTGGYKVAVSAPYYAAAGGTVTVKR
jgi:hypothetical protein